MNSFSHIWKPSHWVLIETEDLNGDKFRRLLSSYTDKKDNTESWRLSEAIKSKSATPMHVEFTDTQRDTYVCDYDKEGLSDFLAKKYEEFAVEQGTYFNRRVTMLAYGE